MAAILPAELIGNRLAPDQRTNPGNAQVDTVEQEDDQILDHGDTKDLMEGTQPPQQGVDNDGQGDKPHGQYAFRPRAQPQPIHLRQYYHRAKPESEYRPH